MIAFNMIFILSAGCGIIPLDLDRGISYGNAYIEYSSSYKEIGKKLEAVGNEVIDALINNDIEALKVLMSPSAVDTDDFEKGFEYSCSFFDEEIISRTMGGYSNGTSLTLSTFGTTGFELITASQNTISVSIKYYFTYIEHPENVGVYALTVTTPDSAHPNEHSDYYHNRPGIYNPEWNTVTE